MRELQVDTQTFAMGYPALRHLWLELTRKCNLSCSHCYVESSPELPLYEGMRLEDWRRVLSEAAAVGCQSVQFTGGEVTLIPELDQLVEYASAEGFTFIEVYTNATSLTDERVKFYTQYNVHIGCSFYSHREKVHDTITGRPGSFRQTVAGIERALAAGLALRCGFTIMDINRDHYEQALQFLHELGVQRTGGDRLRQIGRGGEGVSAGLGKEDSCGQCAKALMCVTASGDAFPCTMSRSSCVGNVRQQSLAEIFLSRPFFSFRELMAQRALDRVPADSDLGVEAWCEPGNIGSGCEPRPSMGTLCEPFNIGPGCEPRPSAGAVCEPFNIGSGCEPRPSTMTLCEPFNIGSNHEARSFSKVSGEP